MRTTNLDYVAVSDDGDGCDCCEFNGALTTGECLTHACDQHDWPEDHYLRHARNIVWVRKQ